MLTVMKFVKLLTEGRIVIMFLQFIRQVVKVFTEDIHVAFNMILIYNLVPKLLCLSWPYFIIIIMSILAIISY